MIKLVMPFLILYLLVSCNASISDKGRKYEKLIDIISNEYQLSSSVENIIVISHRGCPACNKEYTNFWKAATLDFSDVVFIFTKKNHNSNDLIVDKLREDQIVYDYKELLYRYDLIKSNSAFIKLKSGGIDTIINVNINSIKSDLEYIKTQLNSK